MESGYGTHGSQDDRERGRWESSSGEEEEKKEEEATHAVEEATVPCQHIRVFVAEFLVLSG